MSDEDERILDEIVQEMEAERDAQESIGAKRSSPVQVSSAAFPDVQWLNQGSVQVLHDYLQYLASADDVESCIRRMRTLADFLNAEADKLQAKGAINFQQSFDLH